MEQNIAQFVSTLPVMLYGMLGIFIVMITVAAAIALLKKTFK